MPKQFNFYQHQYGTTGGFIAPFFSHFTGFYASLMMLEGGGAGFHFPIISDYDLTPLNLNYRISGRNTGNLIDSCILFNTFSGNLYPTHVDSGSLSINLSGRIDSGFYDSINLNPNYSGAQSGAYLDIINLNHNISGKNRREIVDNFYYNTNITGSVSSGDGNIIYMTPRYSGNIIGNVNKAYTSFNITMTACTYTFFGGHTNKTGDAEASFNMVLSRIIYKPPHLG